jgi:hypothetical protein
VGTGSFAGATGGSTNPLQIGNNTAITVGNGSKAVAETGTNKFAAAIGNNKTVSK